MPNLKLFMHNAMRTLHPGAQIRGRIECNFRDNTTVRSIKVRLKCQEHNAWTRTELYVDSSDENKLKTKEVRYSGDRDIIRKDYILVGSDSGTVVLSRGRHEYPFSFTLPDSIPSSFNGPYGSISYQIKGIADRPFKFDYEDTCYFKVKALIDFNKWPRRYQNPASYSDEKTVCEWCCQGGQITMDVTLPKTAFVLDEEMNLKVDVCNMSNSNVEQLNVLLTQNITYHVTSPSHDSKESEMEMASTWKHGVGAHGQHTYNFPLRIRQFSVPNFELCRLFEVSYKLQVSCQMPTCTLNLDINIWDIEMGDISWRRVGGLDSPPSYQPPLPGPSAPPPPPSAPIDSTRRSAPLKEEEELPPSYNEAQQASQSGGFYLPHQKT